MADRLVAGGVSSARCVRAARHRIVAEVAVRKRTLRKNQAILPISELWSTARTRAAHTMSCSWSSTRPHSMNSSSLANGVSESVNTCATASRMRGSNMGHDATKASMPGGANAALWSPSGQFQRCGQRPLPARPCSVWAIEEERSRLARVRDRVVPRRSWQNRLAWPACHCRRTVYTYYGRYSEPNNSNER